MANEEEELLNRNTDCVYFLASPFTCKKGLECEFRHNEISRLNPRECWYWLAGNCLNPTCGFRHPPLDTRNETSSESAKLPYENDSVPVNKNSIPCYFYFNSFCNKGDRCFFLHGHDSRAPSGNSVKTDVLPMETRTLTERNSRSAPTEMNSGSRPTEIHQNPSGTPVKSTTDVTVQGKGGFLQSDFASSDAVVRAGSLVLADFVRTHSPVHTDHSYIKREYKQESVKILKI